MGNRVEFRNISKYFPGVKALDNISFQAESGYVYAFLGENGAGKSTLLKILNGDYQPDEGSYIINGEEKHFLSPKDAIAGGVSVIYQERQVVMEMTVAENVFLGDWPLKKNGGIDYNTMNRRTQEIIERFGLTGVESDQKVKDLSIAMQQMVEIMKAAIRDAQIIAFDEPTASLSDHEIEVLFRIIRELQDEGKVVFYVSHRMHEIAQIAQKVIVFKDGCLVDVVDQADVTEDQLINMMVGRSLGSIFDQLERNTQIGDVMLEVNNLTTPYVTDISFNVRKGEILGFGGLVGAGRSETIHALFGLDRIEHGEIYLEGKRIEPHSPEEAIAMGFALVPEDRKEMGILPNISVRGNISVTILRSLQNAMGSIDLMKEEQIAQKEIEKLNIKTPDSDKLISQLSGGNQQKVILGRWLETSPKVLILDEPTKGIDVGAKAEFYKIICECAKSGMAVIVISSELTELIGLADRIVVLREGRLTGEVLREQATEAKLLGYAMANNG